MTTELFTSTYEATTDGVTDFGNISTESVYTSVPTTVPLTFNVTTSTPKDNSNLGLTVGLSVGIPCGVAVIIAVILAIMYFKSKNNNKTLAKHEDDNPANTYVNVNTTVPSACTDTFYENVISRRDNAVYENPSASEDLYATTLSDT